MNLLYISNLSGKKSAGLTYSIPAQIKSQKQHDNVFWYNINNVNKSKIINGHECYNLDDFPELDINKLPKPFNVPDLVIFEGVYFVDYVKIANQCIKEKIPYIIIPRSSLTKFAQRKSSVKKTIANLISFKRFINNAAAIQYLTKREHEDSGLKWNKRHIIIPNGVTQKERKKKQNTTNEIRGIFIGRSDSYQKGIDLLLDACVVVKEHLISNNVKIYIFAPRSSKDKDIIEEMIDSRNLRDVIFGSDGVYGSEKEDELLKSDFFILTSRFEGHPMGLIEALSYGLPCLITEGTNMKDEVETADAGWTADTSVEGIVRAFQSMFREIDDFSEKGKNAYLLSNKYNWDNIAKISHVKYKKLLKGE